MGDAGKERMTGTGLSIGSPQCMSPEQAMGERDLGARSEVYSLAAVAYEMLAGEPPFNGPTSQVMIAKLMTEKPTSPRVVRDVVTPALDLAVMKALAKSPTDRFATSRKFADALTKSAAPVNEKTHWMIPAAIVVAVAAVALIAVKMRTGTSSPNTPATATAASTTTQTIRPIAVLPLANNSPESTQDYFAEGMTDELTSDPASISSLRVIARRSAMQFTRKNRPPTRDIAKALGVDAFVEGSVTRDGKRVRITAQLIDARLNSTIWSDKFERNSSDVFTLQADLASAVAGAVKVALTPVEQSRLASVKAVNPEAHDAYLKGGYFFSRPSDDNLKKAIEQFEIAVRQDPTFAPAYSGLSDAYVWAGYNEGLTTATAAGSKARDAAVEAVSLNRTSAEAHALLATYKLFYEYDWVGCKREFRKAITLHDNYAFAHDHFGMALGFVGRVEESIAGKASVLPFNLAMVHLGVGEKARAIAYLEQALAADSQMLAWPGHDAIFDSLRGEPRFVTLLKRLNFVK